jgi:hydroxymethylbilane synthase
MKTLRIATRKSALALWQAEWVKARLEAAGQPCELVTLETIGDKKLDTTIAKIGSKGVFTEELEALLELKEVELAVHSAKDLASELPEGFEIIAFGPREEVNDVLVSHKEIDITKPQLIGTSSTRRVAQLARYYPQFSTTPVRGNLQTRIRKMEEGVCDALLLAKAGVLRMSQADLIRHEFPLDKLTPAAGQGSVAVEVHESLPSQIKLLIRSAVNDADAEIAILSERTFLHKMNGGCSIPVFAHAQLRGKEIVLQGGILSLDGKTEIRDQQTHTSPELLGFRLAQGILAAGGSAVLEEIKKEIH